MPTTPPHRSPPTPRVTTPRVDRRVPDLDAADAALIRRARFLSARTAFGSDAELAAALGADRSRAARWKAGAAMDDVRWRYLQAIDTVVGLLRGFLEPSTIPKWLRGVNAHLGHRTPLDVLREGRLSDVVAAVEAEQSGAFA